MIFRTNLTIHFSGAGDNTPKNIVENAVWNRHKTYDLVEDKVVKGKYDTDWQATPEIYPEVKVPKINGYIAEIDKIAAMPVAKESITKEVKYTLSKVAMTQPPVKPDLSEKNETANFCIGLWKNGQVHC